MIWLRPIGSIRLHSNSGIRGTLDTKLIRCVDVRETQIHKLWCLGMDNVTCKIHLTAQVEVGAGTVGDFTTNYLGENGRRILITRQLSINGSVQFLGIPNFVRGIGFSFIENLQDPTFSPLARGTLMSQIRTEEVSQG